MTRKENQLAPCERVVTELGIKSNLFRVDCTQDCEKDFTKENLQNYDIVFFYTTGNLPIKEETLAYFYNEWFEAKRARIHRRALRSRYFHNSTLLGHDRWHVQRPSLGLGRYRNHFRYTIRSIPSLQQTVGRRIYHQG